MSASQHVMHGRRKNMPKSFDQSSNIDSPPRQFEFSLALKPGTLPHDIESDHLHKAVENEYIAKYLERIGAAPTKANMDYVRKHAPLAKENVKANLKAKGNMTDEVAMQAPDMDVDVHLPPRVPNKSMLVVGMVNHVQNGDETDHGDFIKPWGADLKTAGVREVVAERGEEPQFDDMTSKFVYPYNIRLQGMQNVRKLAKAKLERQKSQTRLSSRSPSRTGTVTGRSESGETSRSHGTSVGGFSFAAEEESNQQEPQPLQDERSGRLVSEEDLAVELEGDFEVTPEVVLALQSDFEHSLRQWRESVSDETMGRVTASDFQATLEALCSDLVLHLFGTVCAYMYDEYVNPSRRNEFETTSESAEWETMQRDRSFVMHRQFASITKEYRSSRSRLFFTLPILILSMRTCVETLFREVFPLWTSIPAGVKAMRLMQETITELFDPHGYYSNLSILQSAPAAVRIMDSYKRLAHRQLNHGFSATSPLVKAAYSNTKAFGTRQMLYRQQQQQQYRKDKSEERLAPAPELAPDQKFKLMDMARSIPKKGKDLRQLGKNNRTDRAKWLQT